jgi:SAM-dependent methyltransferase
MNARLACRFCSSPLREVFADLGTTPLANSYVSAARLAKTPEESYPLVARLCTECLLVQVEDVVPPSAIFSDYAYFSSYSTAWVEHARIYAGAMRKRFGLGPKSKVVEIASNDGYLLKHFVAAGIPVLGVEPAANVAAVAVANNVPTEVAFFGLDTAERLAKAGHGADLMAANNVLAHVPDLNGFVAGFKRLLKPQGVATFEFPHLLRLIAQVQFDTIYHEHFSYFSLLTAERVFTRHGLRVFDVEELPTHGGSLRLFVGHEGAGQKEGPGLFAVRAAESSARLGEPASYRGFQARVERVRDGFLKFLDGEKRQGRQIAGYGAAAKGNTLLNYCRVGTDRIAYVVDRNPHKQGLLLPGSHLPIFGPEKVFETKPDDLVILPWNVADEVAREMAGIGAWNGRFVIAVPEIRFIVGSGGGSGGGGAR